ncbi:membrane protein [Salmonella enterica subsp. enterica serovar Heidelberg]|nr:membrane protein [Salmonella enterica subsp. enterica serovar Heidelberg]
MDKKIINPEFTLEEQLIIIIDKYISKRYQPGDKNFLLSFILSVRWLSFKVFLPKTAIHSF